MKFIILLFFFVYFTHVNGDVYLHNPRGSNNRCDELSNDRNNANRLFDSQNNAAGGYACPCSRLVDNITCYKMKYYMETVIPIRWTSQHNCGDNNDCTIIIQYGCEGELSTNVRDGQPQSINGNTCTGTIPEESDLNIDNYMKYGKHEDSYYYEQCKQRLRNKRLFTADQRLRGNSAIYTRQNPNGNRYGFECPEERDYYPYWSFSEWRDIAVLTSNTSLCDYYYNNSRCNTNKHDCVGLNLNNNLYFPINETDCESQGGQWVVQNKFDDCNMTCVNAPNSPINRLGSGIYDDKHNTFYWKVPHGIEKNNCVIRIRYNISTKETPWEFTIENNMMLENNPVMNTSSGVPIRLAINTAQYSRVFEDRTWTFDIIERPEKYIDKVIHNINVQGKRGNIAQVRNCIEYDFVPNNITITENDYIHFQWVGSDYNPLNNDGEGRAGTDRSNIVEIKTNKHNVPDLEELFDTSISYVLSSLNQEINNPNMCFTYDELYLLNKRNDQQSLKNCALLNNAGPYFNFPPIKITKNGTYIFMSSRNNNFSNRGQKLIININQYMKSVEANNEYSSGNTHNMGTVIVLLILCCLTLLIGFVGVRRCIKSKGGVDKIKINIKRNFQSKV